MEEGMKGEKYGKRKLRRQVEKEKGREYMEEGTKGEK